MSRVVLEDDLLFAGVETDLEWARRQLEKRFLVKVIGRHGTMNKTCTSSENSIGSCLGRGMGSGGVNKQQKKDRVGDGDETPLNET